MAKGMETFVYEKHILPKTGTAASCVSGILMGVETLAERSEERPGPGPESCCLIVNGLLVRGHSPVAWYLQ